MLSGGVDMKHRVTKAQLITREIIVKSLELEENQDYNLINLHILPFLFIIDRNQTFFDQDQFLDVHT